ncbi:MAG: hypothetical protein ACKOB8_03595 [Mycobacterium sp.]
MLRTAALVAAVTIIAGCASTTPPPDTTVGPTGHGTLAACLRDHGVPESAGPAAVLGPPAGVDQRTWQQAMSACEEFAPGPPAP